MTPNELLDIVIAAEKIRDFCCDQPNCAYCPAWMGEGCGCGFEDMPYEWADLILKLEDKTMENEKNCENCLYNVLDPAFPPCSKCIGQGGEKDNWADESSDGLDCEECKL